MLVDSGFPSITLGVSQQILSARPEGFVENQLNMLADRITGPRRRPGVTAVKNYVDATVGTELVTFYFEVENAGYHILINHLNGQVKVLDADMTVLNTFTDTYLIAANPSSLRTASSGGYMWALNTEKMPTLGAADPVIRNPSFDGWFAVGSTAFSKSYNVRVECPGFSATYTYTTPSGAGAGDIAKSTGEYIATELYNAMLLDTAFTIKFNVWREGAYVFLTRNPEHTVAGVTKVTSSSGKTYMVTSNGMLVALPIDLAANLPPEANGCLTTVGSNPRSYTYYYWRDSLGQWVETAAYGSAATLDNMPRRLSIIDAIPALTAPVFEGRLAGDDLTNPYSAFTVFGITGISAYQGRLVLLAGPYACLSASNRPLRFMRSTITELRTDDPIESSAGALTAASFQYAIPFNKDLILISAAHQAVIPAGNAGITPQNAMVLPSTAESISTTSEPRVIGRSLMYATDASDAFFGIGEMIPSQYSASQYSTQALTQHIPRYMGGKCRKLIASSNSSMGAFLSSTERNSIWINEFQWVDDTRQQNAWHRWDFPLPVLSAHFAQGRLVVWLKSGTRILGGTVDSRLASYQQAATIPPFVDNFSQVTVVANKFTLPVQLRDLSLVDRIRCAQVAGALSGEPIGIKAINTTTWEVTTMRSFPDGQAAVGWNFTSVFSPSSPLMRDADRRAILHEDTNILLYKVGVSNTGEFDINITEVGYPIFDTDDSALHWSSSELGLGQKQVVLVGTVTIPVRAKPQNVVVTLSTDSTREMNLTNIDYTLRTHLRRKRM